MPAPSTVVRGVVAPTALAFAALLAAPRAHAAQEPTPSQEEVDRTVDRLEAALSRESGLSQETRDALMAAVRALRARRPEPEPSARGETIEPAIQDALRRIAALETAAPATAAPSPLSFYGDLRLRGESNFHLDDQRDRTRFRLRLRAGADYAVAETLQAGARVTTGPRNDPRAPHQTLGDSFNRYEINLDRVYASWRPDCVKGLALTGGKFGHPFYANPVYADLVWDADVQPEGIVGALARERVGPFERVQVAAGEYILLEQGADSEAFATVAQVSAQSKLGERWKANAAAGIYRYSDLTPDDSQAVLSHNSGNATVGAAPTLDFASRFTILNPIAAVSYSGFPYPLVVSGEWIKNTRAAIGGDTGYAVGAAYGTAQQEGDWRLYYQWQVVEQDAVLTPVAGDDSILGTDFRGHILGVNHQILDRVGVHLWALLAARDNPRPGATTDGDHLQKRIRFDLNVRF